MFNKIGWFFKERCKLKVKYVYGFKFVEFDVYFLEYNVVCVDIKLFFFYGCVYYVCDIKIM